MAKNLVIVESPAKAKTISQFLSKDYEVKSSFGHIRDLPAKGLNVDIANNFEPDYAVSPDKQKIVNDLKKASKGATVWLASDEDREGEAIAWHLANVLKLPIDETKRIVFHEITKTAIDSALQHPRTINTRIVDAQQARRVLDRLVGYELSPVLWKKVRPGLSAGRVQSVAVRLIVEREREIAAYKGEKYFKTFGVFLSDHKEFNAELNTQFKTKDEVIDWLNSVKNAEYMVSDIKQKPSKRSPSAPFTTSSLQQEASRKLGFSVRQTMTIAQRLYESGHITYMRTDSTILSKLAISEAEKYIKSTFGDSYHNSKQYATKNSSAQEAHEAIRPTIFSKEFAGEDNNQKKLYNLIWKRTIASQMSSASLDKTEIKIDISTTKSEYFLAKGEVLVFDGYLKVYGGAKDDILLPAIKVGDKLDLSQITSTENFSRAPARYSEASLVKKLEELGIGRPSTYAPTISVIQTRGYVEKKDLEGEVVNVIDIMLKDQKVSESSHEMTRGADQGKLLPTQVAEVVNDFLVKYFPSVVDYDFTAKAEDDFDKIAEGNVVWQDMIKDFYAKFHELVVDSEKISRSEVSKTREVGIDPKSNQPIFARIGRYGPMLQKGSAEDKENKPSFASLPKGKTIDDITLEEALEMFKLPKVLGKTEEGEDIEANIGRFGPYIKIGKKFISIKPHDPMTITLEEALELFKAKQEVDAKKTIKEFDNGVKILNGPYGAYITNGKKNARLSKDTDATKLTEEEATKLLDEAKIKKFKRRTKSKA